MRDHEDDLILTTEAAALVGCSTRHVARLVQSGELRPAVKAAGTRGPLVFRRGDVAALLARRRAS